MVDREEALRTRYGPWAVVTGASEGIGRAIAVELAESQVHLVLVARRAELIGGLARELAWTHGIDARAVAADLGTPEGVDAVLGATRDVDAGLLVAAAGFGTSGPFLDASIDDELDLVDVNCRAVVALSHAFGRRFVARGRGGIVLLSSLLAFQGVPRAANYAASKAFVQAFGEGLRAELSGFGVDVLASAPGPVMSGFGRRAGMRITSGLSPRIVARSTLAALGNGGTVRPGFLSKALELSLAPLPRIARTAILARVMERMTSLR